MVPVSALKGDGVDDLLERIALEAEILELKAHHEGAAQGVIIESELDKFRGSVSTFLIQNGTLKVGDLVVSGNAIGKIKSIVNTSSGPGITSEREYAHIFKSIEILENINLKDISLTAEDIRAAINEISEITKKTDNEDILDIIFNEFCIGK